jgi:DNA-binding FadR family transcriptional regulator
MTHEEERLKKIIQKMKHVQYLICFLAKDHNVGDTIIGQHLLKDELGETLEKTREAMFCLECFGYVERDHGKKTKIIKDIKPLKDFFE